MGKYANETSYPLGVRIGSANGEVDWAMLKEGGVKFAVLKAVKVPYYNTPLKDTDDESLATHVGNCAANDIPVIAEVELNPQYYADQTSVNDTELAEFTYKTDLHVAGLIRALSNKTYHAIMVNVSRWWIKQEVYDSGVTKNEAALGVIAPNIIYATAKHLIETIQYAMKIGQLRTVPILFYSGAWFIELYGKGDNGDLYSLIANKQLPVAEALYVGYTGAYDWSKVRTLMPTDASKPTGLNGVCKLWHISGDRISLPLSKTNVAKTDLFLSYVPLDQLYSFLGFTPDEGGEEGSNTENENNSNENAGGAVSNEDIAVLKAQIEGMNRLLLSVVDQVGKIASHFV